MNVRRLDLTEHENTRSLYREVFSEDSQAFVDYYYTEKTKDNQIYVLEEDGDIQAMMHLNPYRMYVNAQEKVLHYIVAVATRKAYRKRGYMGELLRRSLIDMSRQKEPFTFLMPAAEAIYLPYDFRTVYEQQHRYYQEEEDGQFDGVIQQVESADMKRLANIANTYLKEHYQIFALRDEAYYNRLSKEYGSDDGQLMVYKKGDSICDLRLWVKQEEEHPPQIMVRILNLERMLMAVSLKSLTAVCFEVSDKIIEENNRCLVLTGTEFSGVMVMDGMKKNSEGTITIAAMASLLFGAKSVQEVCGQEGVFMSERMKQELEKLIPLSHIYINEVV